MKSYKDILRDYEAVAGPIEPHAQLLRKYADKLKAWAEEIDEITLAKLKSYEPMAALHEGMNFHIKDWFIAVVSGQYVDYFWQFQYDKGGLVHVALGVANEYMLAFTALIQSVFLDKLIEEFPPDEAIKIFRAFNHVTQAINTVISTGYTNTYLAAVSESTGMPIKLIERHAQLIGGRWLKEKSPTK